MSTSTAYYFLDAFGFGISGFIFTLTLAFIVIGLGTKLMRNE